MKVTKIALIPAYMPTQAMLPMLGELCDNGFENIVVNDGSGNVFDDCFDKAREKATVIDHPHNFGKGVALRTGLTYISAHYTSPYVVVTLDADGQHLVSDALRVCERAAECPDALVLGSRALDTEVPVRSRIGNTVTRHVYSAATGVRVHDTQTGLRAFHRSLIPRLLEIEGDRYEYEINMLMQLAAEGVPIIEERIETVYEDNNSGSHFRTIRDSVRVYKEILKFSASSLASFAIDYGMYALLLAATGAAGVANGAVISNIGARLVSASANYTMNKKLVFKSRTGFARSAAQ